jgi:hypothetical protein
LAYVHRWGGRNQGPGNEQAGGGITPSLKSSSAMTTFTKFDLARSIIGGIGLNREAREMVEAFFKEISDCLD